MQRTALTLAALLSTAATPALADTLIDNAKGVQVDASGKLQRFTGLLIGDDGKVVRLLAEGEARPNATTRIDAGGRALLPGLVDAHGHVMGLGTAALQLDLTGTKSIAELQQRLRDYAAANPGKGWIRGRGWNQELWSDARFPTAADLDAAVDNRPVWLERVDGHASVGNSAALKAAGITAATKAPSGGRIENGLFVDAAAALVDRKIPGASTADRDAALAKAQELLLSVGVTAAADMGTTVDDWRTMQRAGQRGALKVRVMSYASDLDALASAAGKKPTAWLHDGHLRMAGIKIYADGALGSRGAWLKAPYHDMPNTRGLSLIQDAQLRDRAGKAAAGGFQVAIHAIGDAANQQVITAFEGMNARYTGDRRWRIEHAQVLDPNDLPRLAKAGIIASMQPTHQTSDRTMAEARLGPQRLDGAYAWQTIARTGARLAFGSDFPVEAPNPFPGLAAAISRQDPLGQPAGGWRPQDKVSVEQALSGFTRDAAYAGFAEDKFGALEPGRYADFILVDRDITTAAPTDVAAAKVLETWVGGKKVWASAGATPAR
ncbi:amidohydrolase [Sphingomonas sp. LY160]|uniref:amidohydrolase n=1 Tax=Sphingomonas sp. LY160 TaxID=3095342 RepID=UPI002ADED5CD|nr:amidohydrolase family protein [Sphingomonas sp. LY160]MEA1071857.1 amidohydrolase family protein [Sphingomonas sp. LY160]